MSVLNNEVYSNRITDLTFSKDAWLIGKFCANDIYDFTADLARIKEEFGRSLKIRLKLSPKGLTSGGSMTKILEPSRIPSKEHFDLSRICDIYQDRKYANVLVCIFKSRIPNYLFEVFAYKLQRPKDVLEFQDLFTELVTGTPRQRPEDHVDYRFSTLSLAPTKNEGTYMTNGSAKTSTLRFASPTLRTLDSSIYGHRLDMNQPFHESYYPRKIRLRDVGIQVNREKMGVANGGEQCHLFCQRTKVYSFNNAVLSDVACMTSPSGWFDDSDGQAVVHTRGNQNQLRREFANYEDWYRPKTYSPSFRNEYNSRSKSPSPRKTQREIQSRMMSISNSGSSDEVQVHLTGERNRNGNIHHRTQDYLDYSAAYEKKGFRKQGLNGDLYYGRSQF